MQSHRKALSAIVAIGALTIVGAAQATSHAPQFKTENAASMGVPTTGPNAINPKTCRFIHRERDVVTNLGTLGQKLAENGKYDVAEDARHDAKMNCLTNLINKKKGIPGARGPAGPAGRNGAPGAPGAPGGLAHYVQVTATGIGQTVTATCPQGDVVLGGGSPSETTGSWPSSATSWSVRRDNLSPKTLTVIATCALAVS